jgi:hypothetical protein
MLSGYSALQIKTSIWIRPSPTEWQSLWLYLYSLWRKGQHLQSGAFTSAHTTAIGLSRCKRPSTIPSQSLRRHKCTFQYANRTNALEKGKIIPYKIQCSSSSLGEATAHSSPSSQGVRMFPAAGTCLKPGNVVCTLCIGLFAGFAP